MPVHPHPATPTPGHRGGLLRQPSFLQFWAAEVISAAGSQVTLLALPLTAALWLDASAGEMGLLRAAQTGPFLLVGLLAGVWVDRLRRQPILVAADLGRALLLATIPLAAAQGGLGMVQLYGVSFLVGALTLLFSVAHGALLPTFVGHEHLVTANSALIASGQVVAVAGPGLAGLLLTWLSAPTAIAVDAVSFAASGVLLAWLRIWEPSLPAPTERRSVGADLGEGLRFVWSRPIVRTVSLAMGTYNFFGGMGSALYVLYATRTLGLSAATLGAVLAAGGVGGVVGALAAGRLARRLGVGPTLIGALALVGAGALGTPLAALRPAVAVPVLASGLTVFGVGAAVFSVTAISLLQACTPERLLGRMTAATRVLLVGATAVGALLGGAIAERVGLTSALWVTVAGAPLVLPLLWWPPVRTLSDPALPAEVRP